MQRGHLKQSKLTREEARQQTKQRLLRAALEVFSRYGYEGASVDRISDHAGFTKGAFYSNFGSKDEILLAVLQEHTRRELLDLEALVSETHLLDEKDGVQLLGRLTAYYELSATRLDAGMLMAEFQLQSARDRKFARKFIPVFTLHQEALSSLMARAFSNSPRSLLSAGEITALLMAISVGIALQTRSQRHAGSDLFGKALGYILRQGLKA